MAHMEFEVKYHLKNPDIDRMLLPPIVWEILEGKGYETLGGCCPISTESLTGGGTRSLCVASFYAFLLD